MFRQISLILLLVFLLIPTYSYLQIPLTKIKKQKQQVYTIQVQILKSKYQLSLSLEKETQYLNPPKNAKPPNQNHSIIGYLDGHSLEQNNNAEGWRRYFIEAFLFIQSKYNHKFELNLDWMQIKHNLSLPTNGIISLSPSILHDKFFNEIKNSYSHFTSDQFAIYVGSNNKASIQFGGYETKYAYPTVTGQIYKVVLQDSDDEWIVSINKLAFTKDDNGKYADYVLSQEGIGLKLSLSHNKLTIPKQITNVLLIALESQQITCKFQTNLICSNMSSLDMALHQFVFPINSDFSVNVSMYRLLNECDTKAQTCKFNVQVANKYEIGTSFFQDHYTIFNIQNKYMLIGLSNKYPTQWFSTVYILRAIIILFIVMVITACVIDSPKYFSFLKHRRDEIQGVELVSHQQLHEF